VSALNAALGVVLMAYAVVGCGISGKGTACAFPFPVAPVLSETFNDSGNAEVATQG
jgi:hypothetical protein